MRYIPGLAFNDSTIDVYLDGQYRESFTVNNHWSGVTNFSYAIDTSGLTSGSHYVYMYAKNTNGKISERSNIIYFEKIW